MKNIIFLFAVVVATTSCIKKKLGCSEPQAINYDVNIETNDDYSGNDCMYEATGVFYWDINTYFDYFVDSSSTFVI